MPLSRGETKKAESDNSDANSKKCREELASERAGLPDANSVLEEKEFKSPSGRKYRILKTTETDEYEELRRTSIPKDKKK